MTQEERICRHNPERTAKATKPGTLKETELQNRTIKPFKNPYKTKTDQLDVEMVEMQPAEEWDPSNPYQMIRIDQN